eukprot:RCo042874
MESVREKTAPASCPQQPEAQNVVQSESDGSVAVSEPVCEAKPQAVVRVVDEKATAQPNVWRSYAACVRRTNEVAAPSSILRTTDDLGSQVNEKCCETAQLISEKSIKNAVEPQLPTFHFDTNSSCQAGGALDFTPTPSAEQVAGRGLSSAQPSAAFPVKSTWADRVRPRIQSGAAPDLSSTPVLSEKSPKEPAVEESPQLKEQAGTSTSSTHEELEKTEESRVQESPWVSHTNQKKTKQPPSLLRKVKSTSRRSNSLSQPATSKLRTQPHREVACATTSVRVAWKPAPWASREGRFPANPSHPERLTVPPLAEHPSPLSTFLPSCCEVASPAPAPSSESSETAVAAFDSSLASAFSSQAGFGSAPEPEMLEKGSFQGEVPKQSWAELAKVCRPDSRKVKMCNLSCEEAKARPHPETKPNTQLLWIGSLRVRHDERWLTELFQPYGLIRLVERSEGYAICEFPMDSAPRVVTDFHNVKVDGKKFVVRLSTRCDSASS